MQIIPLQNPQQQVAAHMLHTPATALAHALPSQEGNVALRNIGRVILPHSLHTPSNSQACTLPSQRGECHKGADF